MLRLIIGKAGTGKTAAVIGEIREAVEKGVGGSMLIVPEQYSHDLSYIYGERESGPNGDKKTFLRVGKAFLHALSKDLRLRDAKITSNAGGIAVSGECTLIGMWEDSGIYICIEQPCFMGEPNILATYP